jgi:hypothetical protein
MVLYEVSTISGESRVFLITLGLQPYIHKRFNSCSFFFLIGLIDNVLFSFLYSIPVFSEGNIVDHIFAKHKLTWCCLQRCMIGASNSLITMKLIEGSNQIDYILVLLDFHDCFHFQVK